MFFRTHNGGTTFEKFYLFYFRASVPLCNVTATRCNVTGTRCNIEYITVHDSARHCDTHTLQHTHNATHTHCITCAIPARRRLFAMSLQHTATHCTTLHHTATHCNTLHHTATHLLHFCASAPFRNVHMIAWAGLHLLQCVRVCCSVLKCVAVCCSVL